jgi:hypothetical protein
MGLDEQYVDRSTYYSCRLIDTNSRSIEGEQCVDWSTKKVDRSTFVVNRFMHRIFENPIFNTKSPQIFFLAIGYDRFGAILAVRFSINRAQPSCSIHASILSKSLSISLPISLKFSSLSISDRLSLGLGLAQSKERKED